MPKAEKRRKFKGYAALNRRGNLLWGTLSIKAEDAQAKHDKWNPDGGGEGQGETIVEVDIYIKS
jgi:hypothetical protein